MKYCKRYKKTHYYLPIYGVHMNIVFDKDTFLYLCEKYQNYKPEGELSNNGLCFINPENDNIMIGVFNDNMETIVHEVTHATLFILDRRNMNPQDSSGEAMAYLQGHLFSLVNKKMRKHNDKK